MCNAGRTINQEAVSGRTTKGDQFAGISCCQRESQGPSVTSFSSSNVNSLVVRGHLIYSTSWWSVDNCSKYTF